MKARVAAIAVLLPLAACQPSHPAPGPAGSEAPAPHAAPVHAPTATRAPPADATPAAPTGIAWFRGSIEQAFATAQREQRPVLLFWGAQWCPFCHTLKATVFTRPDFIAKTRLFVPVYLDGDDAGAQRWGERFGVIGYPTLVLLDPQRHELLRLGAGRDVSAYAALLDLGLERVRPVDTLLGKAAAHLPLSSDECRRLAFNSWELDTLEPRDYGERASRLLAAAQACPPHASVERADLIIYAAGFAADAVPPVPALRGSLTDRVGSILSAPQLAAASAPALQNLGAPFFAAVRARGAHFAARLRSGYLAVMDAAAADPRYVTADQLGFVDAKIVALRALGGARELTPGLLAAADRRIEQALAAEQSPYVRPGLVNASLGILEDSNQYRLAYRIARDEVSRADAPYYYQADLAEIAEQLGHRHEAIALLKQSYQGARGPATRFQWGQRYLAGLLRMAPQDAARIQRVGLQVLGELDGSDRIADRTRVRLAQLDAQLRAWNRAARGAHAAVLRALRERMREQCARLDAEGTAHAGCAAFLSTST